jgi:hypothetical protein
VAVIGPLPNKYSIFFFYLLYIERRLPISAAKPIRRSENENSIRHQTGFFRDQAIKKKGLGILWVYAKDIQEPGGNGGTLPSVQRSGSTLTQRAG